MLYLGIALSRQERRMEREAEERADNFERDRRFYVIDVANGGEWDGDRIEEVFEGPFREEQAQAKAVELNEAPHPTDIRFEVIENIRMAEADQWFEYQTRGPCQPAPVAAGEPLPVTPRRKPKKARAA